MKEIEFIIEKTPSGQRRIMAPNGDASDWFNRDQIAYIYYMGFHVALPSDVGSFRADKVYELLDEEA